MSGFIRTTLRSRLTVLYASLLAATLLLYAGGVSAFFLHNLHEQLDSSLTRDVETVEAVLSIDATGALKLTSHEGEAEHRERDRGYLLEVWSQNGNLLYRSEQLHDQALGPVPATIVSGRQSAHSLRLPSGLQVRTISRVHHMGKDKAVVVRLAVNEGPLWSEFWQMVLVLAIGLPVAVILVALCGYLLAGRALEPVNAMAHRASQITAELLNERLHIKDPDDELGKLGIAFNTTLARLEQSFAQLRRFTADASHELRTPLTAIKSVGEVSLGMQGDVSYYRDTIGSMLEEANRLTHLVDSLLTMARADANRTQLHRTGVNLYELSKEACGLLEVLAEDKQQTIQVEGDLHAAVLADQTILRQALVNLIHNAVKFSPVGGSIRIAVGESGQDAVIEVRDTGPGIPPADRAHIFERFYRVDKARARAAGGAGLGLSIAQWAVAMHGGSIEVECPHGKGSVFRIRLPRNA
ncbi:MAG TPA: heavy metal sensor histidine kinase [Terracidiphilus sp.]|nr:heavy metal sensor histidine kinase [Terracidiphilus sp.]